MDKKEIAREALEKSREAAGAAIDAHGAWEDAVRVAGVARTAWELAEKESKNEEVE